MSLGVEVYDMRDIVVWILREEWAVPTILKTCVLRWNLGCGNAIVGGGTVVSSVVSLALDAYHGSLMNANSNSEHMGHGSYCTSSFTFPSQCSI